MDFIIYHELLKAMMNATGLVPVGKEKYLNSLRVTEYRDIRVLTTQQIAEAYGVETKKITDNFNNNRSRYIDEKHYICLEGEELKRFKSETENLGFAKNLNKLYLWTEKGAFLHAKSLNTDTAWEVYDRLVDSYFNHSNLLDGLSPELKAVITVDKRVTKVEKRMEHLEQDMPLFGAESDEISAHVKRKGVEVLGGKRSEAYKDKALRQKVYTDIYSQLKREFGIYDEEGKAKSYKALKRKNLADAHEFIDCYTLPAYLAEQINDCNAQLKLEDGVDGV